MAFIHDNALSFALDLLGANLQHTDEANLFLTLGLDTDNLTSFKGILSIRQTASGGGKTRGHECCAR